MLSPVDTELLSKYWLSRVHTGWLGFPATDLRTKAPLEEREIQFFSDFTLLSHSVTQTEREKEFENAYNDVHKDVLLDYSAAQPPPPQFFTARWKKFRYDNR